MERSDALKRTLESLSRVYEGKKRVPVEFGSPSRAVPAGGDLNGQHVGEDTVVVSPNVRDELGRDLDGAQELRCIANTLSHEIEHLRESDLTSKEEFMEQYPEHRQFAGMVINVLEDQYIDFTRTQRFNGLRKAQAFVVETLMKNHHRWPRVDNIESRPKAMFEAFRQLAFAGYAKGFSDADDDLREFLGRVRPLIDEVRRAHDQQRRKDIAHEAMQIAEEYLPDDDGVDLPDECAVCGEREPVIVAPILGPVCEQCAPGGHGTEDGDGGAQPPEDGDGGGTELPDDLDADDFEVVDGEPPEDAEEITADDLPEGVDPEDILPDDADGAGGGGDGGDEGDGEGGAGDGDGDGAGGDDAGSAGYQRGEGDGDRGEQAPASSDGPGGINPEEWDWLDLDGHEGHTVSIVDDDAEV